ncbi:T9SS type A sorting domain-containing protein [bacterium]|nr:T9SS type A sorting domain-containing protein [bacterium]MBU1873072.1 T9SS type A sorting domain-containing protein [bacterium]
MKITKIVLCVSLIVVLLFATSLMAKSEKGSASQGPFLAKAASSQVTRTLSNISNWSYWMNYNGMSGIDPNSNSGGIYPRGTAGAIFQDGFIWGGKVGTEIRVGGQTYNVGTTQGWIKSDGTAVSKDEPRARIYRIRPDYETLTHAMVVQEAAEANMVSATAVTEAMTDEIIAQYETDWNEWPADLGAPTYADGTPGIANADQVVWFVCNDLDRTNCMGLYGSEPIGIELQVTAWAYAQPGARLGQIIFKKYKMINKSGADVTDMYVAQWCDPDLGEAGDDLCGCDTTLSMGYAYNGSDTDSKYAAFGLAPAAIGYDFFQGPVVGGEPLPMTGFSWFAAGSAISDPTLGEYEGTLQWYNMLLGNTPTDNMTNPTPWTVGNEGTEETMFPMAGDPVTETGDLDAHASFFSPGDRRIALCSGPFTFADGESQEIVVAVVGGLGDSRFSSITDMKMTDAVAQVIFNGNFEGVPKAPTGPKVTARAFEDNIVLEWGSDHNAVAATEEPVIAGYSFEGYNVYQLPSATATKEQGKLLATYDIVNGVKVIEGNRFVPQYGQIVNIPVQYGADFGVKRFFRIEKDYLTGDPLYEGNTYYFAVTAYNYHPSPELIEDKALESTLINMSVIIQEPLPGNIGVLEEPIGGEYELAHSAGTADGGAGYTVIDPYALTGHDYEVFFNQQHYYRDVDGKWKMTNYPDSVGKALGKVMDASPSSITGSVLASATVGTYDLIFTLDLDAGDNWIDGLRIDLPADVTVNTWSMSGSYGTYGTAEGQNCVNMDGTLDESNSITFGDSTRTGFGCIEGTVIVTVNVQPFVLPKTVGYAVYDDGYDGTVVDAEGTITLTELGYEFKSVSHWNVKDLTDGVVVLEDQKVVSGKDVDTGGLEGATAGGIVDGFQVAINASYDAPTDFTAYTHTGPNRTTPDVFDHTRANAWLNYDQAGKPFIITSYADHGWGPYGPTATAWDSYDNAADGAQHGTQSMNLLQLDVELRFTGEYDTPIATSDTTTYHPIKDGTGSLATLASARYYDIKDHPDANNPGTGEPFLVRIPFEVWDVDNNKQISIVIYDRWGNPTKADMYAFHPDNRVYCWFLEEDYAATLTDPVANTNSDLLTWSTVFWNCAWTQGDKVVFQYDNPIQLGVDKFTFSTTAPVLGDAEAAKEAAKKINVFPNPYYAYNALSTNPYDNYVSFTHLPVKATIRIFNLAGVLVRKLEKDDTSQFMQWNLANEANLPVASGMYIAHIDLPDLDMEKVLKIMIIQDRQILEYY